MLYSYHDVRPYIVLDIDYHFILLYFPGFKDDFTVKCYVLNLLRL